MSVVATAAADWNEDDPTKGLIASIEKVIEMRFGPLDAALIRDIQYITDPAQLRQIIRLACSATHFTEIQAAIESAVPPPN